MTPLQQQKTVGISGICFFKCCSWHIIHSTMFTFPCPWSIILSTCNFDYFFYTLRVFFHFCLATLSMTPLYSALGDWPMPMHRTQDLVFISYTLLLNVSSLGIRWQWHVTWSTVSLCSNMEHSDSSSGIWALLCTMYSLHCLFHTVHCAMCTAQCTVYALYAV